MHHWVTPKKYPYPQISAKRGSETLAPMTRRERLIARVVLEFHFYGVRIREEKKMSDINDTVYLDAVPEFLVCPVCGKKADVSKDIKDIFFLFARYHLHCSRCNRIRTFVIKAQMVQGGSLHTQK